MTTSFDEAFSRALAARARQLLPIKEPHQVAEAIKSVSVSQKQSSYNDGDLPTMSQREGSDSSLYYTFVVHFPSKVSASGKLTYDIERAVKDAAQDDEDPSVIDEFANTDLSKTLLAAQKREMERGDLSSNFSDKTEEKIVQAIWQRVSSESTGYRYDYDEVSLSEYPELAIRWSLRGEKVAFRDAKKTGRFTYELAFDASWSLGVDRWAYGSPDWKGGDLR